MGNLLNKKESVIGPNSKIGLDSNCPTCGKYFSKKTTYSEMNKHNEVCKRELEKKNELEKLMKDLVKSKKELDDFEKLSKSKSNTNNSNNINSNNINKNNNNINSNNINKNNNNNNNNINSININKNNNNNINSKNNPVKSKIKNLEHELNLNLVPADNSNSISSHTNYNQFKKIHKKDKVKSNSVLEPNNINPNLLSKQKSYKKDSNKFDKVISNFNSLYLKEFPFDEKLKQFKTHIQNLKIDWREGACTLQLDRDNLLKQSIEQFNTIDPYKELHINFKGEISYDAGGIIREWFTVIFKELQKENLRFFEPAETADFSYKVHSNAQPITEVLDTFHFIGKIISKALLDNITINSCFNKIIYKMILDENVTFDDLVFIDKPLYHSLKELLKTDRISELGLYFVVQYELDNQIVSDELIINGNNIMVTNENVDEYILKRIEHIQQKSKIFINEIKSGIYSLIPENLIKVFSSDEFELLLNGQPFIDIMDWRINTIYKGYNENSIVIINFWAILNDFSQEKLTRFIQFCTGSSRIPLGGFSVLESNRGTISKFCITKIEWNKNNSNFIRAHTCFNRLDVPDFPTFNMLEEAIGFIINNEILGFGVD